MNDGNAQHADPNTNRADAVQPPRGRRFLPAFARLWGPPALYTAAIFVVSSIPLGKPPLVWTFQDKVAHFVEYGILSALLFRAFRARRTAWFASALAFAVAACLGTLDEVHQALVPGRTASALDGVADAGGALTGGVLAALVSGWWRARSTAAGDRNG